MAFFDLKLSNSKFIRYFRSYFLLQGKHIGFYGNFGHGDVGDDAIFFAAENLLGEKLLPVSKRAYTFNPRNLKALLIGGGLLRWESPYLPQKLLNQGKWEFPVILFSTGINCDFGKEFSQNAKDQIRKLCGLAAYVTVRDELSRKFLNTLGVTDVRILPDLELLLEEQPIQSTYQKKRTTIGVVLSPHSEFDRETTNRIADVFAQFCDYLFMKNYDVVILPFEHRSSENTREGQLIKEILNKAKSANRPHVFDNNLNPRELLYVMKKYCDMMVCMRFHSCVFAANAGIPFICVGFNQMHKGFMQLLGKEDLEISLFNGFSVEKLIERFEYLTKNFRKIKDELIEKRNALRAQIQSETQKIKELLEKV